MKTQKRKTYAGSRKKGIKILGKWKPVVLDPSIFASGNLDEIICFEELSDYKLLKSTKALKAKELKRKHNEVVEDNLEGETSLRSKKRKKHKDVHKDSTKAGTLIEYERDELSHSEEEPGNFIDKDDREKIQRDRSSQQQKIKKERKKQKATHKNLIEARNLIENEQDDLFDSEEEHGNVNIESTIDSENMVKDESSHETKIKKKRKKQKRKKNVQAEEQPSAPKSKKTPKNWSENALSVSSGENVDVSAWKNLFVPQEVLKALNYLGFSSPTPIQALALPSAIRDKMDILGAAETGSGKTLAFAIPMIHSILEWQKQESVKEGDEPEGDEPEEGSVKCDKNEIHLIEKQDVATNKDPIQQEDGVEKSFPVGCVKIRDVNFNPVSSINIGTCNKERVLLGLVVTPTRELAVQVKHHIDAVAKFTDIKTALIVGGMAPQKQQRLLGRRPEIIIATPGRLWELIKESHPHLCNLRQLRCLVIDEADRMVEKGHYAELSQLLEMLSDVHYNPKRQTFVFSATLTLIHQAPTRLMQKKSFKKIDKESKVMTLIKKIGMKERSKVIDLTRKQATVETLTETKIHCATDEKDLYLYYFLLQYPGRTMVFANSIDCIKRLCSLLTILDCTPLPLHANMHQKQRLKNLERFAERESCVLLTTDVAARGLDIPSVQHVIHYQIPRTSEIYVHRSGRTARASSDGLSLLLIGPDDVNNFKKIFRTLEKNDDLPIFPVEWKCMTGIEERVNVARMIEKMEYFNSKTKQQNSWCKQTPAIFEIELDDDDFIGGKKNEQAERLKAQSLKAMKKHLKQLLSRPVFNKILRTKYPTESGKLPLPSLPENTLDSALLTISKQKAKKKKR
ncbi:hypothetical protein GDO86_015949 [Hymenochirus boettgeri]|uniref:ATP-dependent RNA helicase n=1 Tax=Hymenochirus boettgeri TaxID=247094 RepID=A0A8T2K106_9PIPI|nr:hypothetical protein GDO86_015949 [Hymenochirus boettgeri]